MRFQLFSRLRNARLAAAACAGTLLIAGAPTWAQLGGVGGSNIAPGGVGPNVGPSIGPGVVGPAIIQAPPIRVQPNNPRVRSNVDQTVRGVRRTANRPIGAVDNRTQQTTAAAVDATETGAATGTFIADVSGHVKADFDNLADEMRQAIDQTRGNVRERLIIVNDRITKISSDLVDRAKETNQQARNRIGEVRDELNKIHNELTTIAGNAAADARAQIITVRDRVDTLRDNLQSAADRRFNGTLESIQSRVETVEQRARDAAENVQARTRNAVDDLQDRAADLTQRAKGLIGDIESRAENLADRTMNHAATISADVQRRAHDDLQQIETDVSNMLTTVNENVRDRLSSVDERLMSIREDLQEKAGETVDMARTRVDGARRRLDEVHTDLQDIAANATDEAKEEVGNLRDRVAEIRDRLNVSGVADTVRDEVRTIRNQVSSFAPGIDVNSDQQGKLGVTVRQGSTALTVTSVFAGSVAAAIGLQPGDQILAINRHRIISHGQLVNELKAAAGSDGRALVMIRRNGRTQELQADLTRAAAATK